ncbi:EamA family transporter, partial [Enterococcus faecium]
GQGLMIYAIGRLSPLVMGIALLIQPVVSASIGWLAYGERLGAPDLIGAMLVAAALVLVRRGS